MINRALYRLLKRCLDTVERLRLWVELFDLGHRGKGSKFKRGIMVVRPRNIFIGNNTFVGERCFIRAGEGEGTITIGQGCQVASNVIFTTTNHIVQRGVPYHGNTDNQPVRVGDNVWIGSGAILLPGVSIGDNCVVAAGSVVTRPFYEESIVIAGVPAKKIKEIR